jgi:hypothetical protein
MQKTLNEITNNILNEHKNEIEFRFSNNPVSYCYVLEKIIYIYYKGFLYPDEIFIFDILHEIGHIKTNTKGMKRCEEEYYATQWAIKEMKKIGLKLSNKRKQEFQNYIWKWRETGIKLNAKNIPSKEQLILTW